MADPENPPLTLENLPVLAVGFGYLPPVCKDGRQSVPDFEGIRVLRTKDPQAIIEGILIELFCLTQSSLFCCDVRDAESSYQGIRVIWPIDSNTRSQEITVS